MKFRAVAISMKVTRKIFLSYTIVIPVVIVIVTNYAVVQNVQNTSVKVTCSGTNGVNTA